MCFFGFFLGGVAWGEKYIHFHPLHQRYLDEYIAIGPNGEGRGLSCLCYMWPCKVSTIVIEVIDLSIVKKTCLVEIAGLFKIGFNRT